MTWYHKITRCVSNICQMPANTFYVLAITILIKFKWQVCSYNYIKHNISRTQHPYVIRRVWRCTQNPYIEEEQTTLWLKEKGQKDKQQSTKHTHKTKDRVTRTH